MKRNKSQELKLCVSDNFFNKENHAPYQSRRDYRSGKDRNTGEWAFNRFRQAHFRVKELAQHITSGKAFTISNFEDNLRRKENFISSQLLGIDCDENVSVDRGFQDEFVSQYAFLGYATPSSTPENPRSRFLFRLSEPITDVTMWERMQLALLKYVADLRPDEKCKDAARMYYGNKTSDFRLVEQNVLPLEVMYNLMKQYPEVEIRHEIAPLGVETNVTTRQGKVVKSNTPPQSYIQAVEEALEVRDTKVNAQGYTRNFACPMCEHEHDYKDPATSYNPALYAVYCFKCGKHYSLWQVGDKLDIDWKEHYEINAQYEPHELDVIEANTEVNSRYISDCDYAIPQPYRGVALVKSPIGSGKTRFASDLIEAISGELGRDTCVLINTHRQSLATHLAEERFNISNYLTSQKVRHEKQLVICVNSLHKLCILGEKLPKYDMIIIDEIEQVLAHITSGVFTENATMKGKVALKSYVLLRQLISETPFVLGLDAHCSRVTTNWLKGLRDDVWAVCNNYQEQKGDLSLWQQQKPLLAHADTLIEQNDEPIVFAVNSLKFAKKLAKRYRNRLGQDKVCVVHGENSQDKDTKKFLENINSELPRYQVLIHTPSIGTGVDIQTKVAAVIGFFYNEPLSAEDCMQMLGRCRQADNLHVWFQGGKHNRSTNPDNLYNELLSKWQETIADIEFDENGEVRPKISTNEQEFLQLASAIQARRFHSYNQLKSHFVHLAEQQYRVHWANPTETELDELCEEWDNINAALQEEYIQRILNARPVPKYEYEKLRGYEITEDVKAGRVRDMLEWTYGQTVTRQVIGHYKKGKGKKQLLQFGDVYYRTLDDVQGMDKEDALDKDILVSDLHYYAPRWKMCDKILSFFLSDEEANQDYIPEEQIEAFGLSFLKQHSTELKRYLKWNGKSKGKNVIQHILRKMGLSLEVDKQFYRREGYPKQYRLNVETFLLIRRYAQQHLAKQNQYKILSKAS